MAKFSFFFFLATGCLSFLSSCQSLEQISIDYMKPAELTFPSSYKKVGVVNNVAEFADKEFRLDDLGTSTEELQIRGAVGYAQADSRAVAESLAQALADQNYFETVVVCDSALRMNAIRPRKRRLTPQEVSKLASDLQVDFLVAVEDVPLKIDLRVMYVPDYECFVGLTDLHAYSVFSIYAPGHDEPLATRTMSDSIRWEDYGWTVQETVQVMVPDDVLLHEGAWLAGTMPATAIVPYWETGIRYYFKGTTAAMRDAAAYARKNSWDAACPLWKQVYETSKKERRRMQCAFNIALGYEMQDDLEQARTWAARAQALAKQIDGISGSDASNPDKKAGENYRLTTRYLSELDKRIAQLPKLQKQTGK